MSNFIKNHEETTKLNQLTLDWIKAKNAEQEFNQKRIAIEKEILDLKQLNYQSSGSVMLDNGVKASFKINRKWDNDFINSNMHLLEELSTDVVPFKITFKEDKKKMDALSVYRKDIYNELQKGLIEKPAKPAFSVITNEEK